MISPVPPIRITACNSNRVNNDGDFVLYWMIAARRPSWNFSLDRAVEWSMKTKKPLLVLEAVRCDYPWASERIHAFVLEGMANNAGELAKAPALYYPYVERVNGEGKGLVEALSSNACVIVTDDFPCFFIPSMIKAAAKKVRVFMEKVDANGLIPLRLSGKVFQSAYHFRRFSQKNLLGLLRQQPKALPFAGLKLKALEAIPKHVSKRWPSLVFEQKAGIRGLLDTLPIDHQVRPVRYCGGLREARSTLNIFMEKRLPFYKEYRNHADQDAESGLSPYLHFGHISSHEIVQMILDWNSWSPENFPGKASGQREGWWGVDENSEAFLDQLITWRELGFQFCQKRKDYDKYESIPSWALTTLQDHSKDMRPSVYTLKEFEEARTHDPLWNAAQKQLLEDGVIHNYLRMFWGKKIVHWSPTPRDALQFMERLNNRYALDGRDPNSYTGIFWVLGRHDRAWGPERAIFGKVRYMSSENTRRKARVKRYLEKWA